MHTRRKKGGSFVRKGSYGCVFHRPPLKCLGERERRSEGNQVSKLMHQKDAIKEYNESKPFKIIDPEKQYFLWAHATCPFDNKSIESANNMGTCLRGTTPVHLTDKDLSLLFSDYGGIDLHHIKLNSMQYANFFRGFGNLLSGLHLLHTNNMAHIDIKPLNIVALDTGDSFLLRFIDFGLSRSTNSINTSSEDTRIVSQFLYPYYPFDFRYVYGDKHKRAFPEELKLWYNTINSLGRAIPSNAFWDVHTGSRKYNQSTVEAFLKRADYTGDAKNVFEKVDVYALGISFAEVYFRLTGHYSKGEGEHQEISTRDGKVSELNNTIFKHKADLFNWHMEIAEKISKPMYQMIKMMIEFEKDKRPTASDILEYFTENIEPNLDLFNSEFTHNALSSLNIPLLPKPFVTGTRPTGTRPTGTNAAFPLPTRATNAAFPLPTREMPVRVAPLTEKHWFNKGRYANKRRNQHGQPLNKQGVINLLKPFENPPPPPPIRPLNKPATTTFAPTNPQRFTRRNQPRTNVNKYLERAPLSNITRVAQTNPLTSENEARMETRKLNALLNSIERSRATKKRR